jgi:hypothetical protein
VAKQTGVRDGGSMTLLRPDGSQFPGSPFTGGGLSGPWVATIDGADNVWVSNFGAPEARINLRVNVRFGSKADSRHNTISCLLCFRKRT